MPAMTGIDHDLANFQPERPDQRAIAPCSWFGLAGIEIFRLVFRGNAGRRFSARPAGCTGLGGGGFLVLLILLFLHHLCGGGGVSVFFLFFLGGGGSPPFY